MPSKCSSKKRTQCKKPCTWRKGTYKSGKRVSKGSCAKPPTRRLIKKKSSCSKKLYKNCKKPCSWRKGTYKNGKRIRKGSCATPRSKSKKSTTKCESKCSDQMKKDCDDPEDCVWRKGSYKNGKPVRKGYCAKKSKKKEKVAASCSPILKLTAKVPVPSSVPLPLQCLLR